jgi:hypothetical protein
MSRGPYDLTEPRPGDRIAYALATRQRRGAQFAAVIAGSLPLARKLDPPALRRRPALRRARDGLMAVRDEIVGDARRCDCRSPGPSIPDANIRRFASEATRPRGALRAERHAQARTWRAACRCGAAALGRQPLLQNPVAVRLNDAAKTQPEVREVCGRGAGAGPPATQYIVRRARRSITD